MGADALESALEGLPGSCVRKRYGASSDSPPRGFESHSLKNTCVFSLVSFGTSKPSYILGFAPAIHSFLSTSIRMRALSMCTLGLSCRSRSPPMRSGNLRRPAHQCRNQHPVSHRRRCPRVCNHPSAQVSVLVGVRKTQPQSCGFHRWLVRRRILRRTERPREANDLHPVREELVAQ